MACAVPRPKKENLEQDERVRAVPDAEKVLKYAMNKSRSYQKSQRRYVEKLIPIQPITIQVKEVDGIRYEWVPCEKISVEI